MLPGQPIPYRTAQLQKEKRRIEVPHVWQDYWEHLVEGISDNEDSIAA
jgi:hypothetical protein